MDYHTSAKASANANASVNASANASVSVANPLKKRQQQKRKQPKGSVPTTAAYKKRGKYNLREKKRETKRMRKALHN